MSLPFYHSYQTTAFLSFCSLFLILCKSVDTRVIRRSVQSWWLRYARWRCTAGALRWRRELPWIASTRQDGGESHSMKATPLLRLHTSPASDHKKPEIRPRLRSFFQWSKNIWFRIFIWGYNSASILSGHTYWNCFNVKISGFIFNFGPFPIGGPVVHLDNVYPDIIARNILSLYCPPYVLRWFFNLWAPLSI